MPTRIIHSMYIIMFLMGLLLSLSGCAVVPGLNTLLGRDRIPVDERVEECEHGVKSHHEERDMKKQKHILDLECFRNTQEEHYDKVHSSTD